MQLCDHAHTQAATLPNPSAPWGFLAMRQSRRRREDEATSGQPRLQLMVNAAFREAIGKGIEIWSNTVIFVFHYKSSIPTFPHH
jgi:hypothetical protein